ncbi:hypothetical protein BH24ACT10_BH24ACT10_02840 [soil metagenome]
MSPTACTPVGRSRDRGGAVQHDGVVVDEQDAVGHSRR